ncbi:MAG: hypothetical protein J5J06_18210 [Phycisphaerae bacterium]|nr:hypothetical protein [Phycisphaerae bacterium]
MRSDNRGANDTGARAIITHPFFHRLPVPEKRRSGNAFEDRFPPKWAAGNDSTGATIRVEAEID